MRRATVVGILLTIITFIIWVVVLIKVTIPNYHGSQFEIGKCSVAEKYVAIDNVPWKDCSCGSTCTSQFPCIDLKAYYAPYHDSNSPRRKGSLHDNYESLVKGCFVIPQCSRDPGINKKRVWESVQRFGTEHSLTSTMSTFTCWARDDDFYFKNIYSAKRGHLALFLPLLFMGISVILLIASSEKARAFCFSFCLQCRYSTCCTKCQGRVTEDVDITLPPDPRLEPVTPVEVTGANSLFYEHYHSAIGPPVGPYNSNEPPPPPYQP